MTKKKKIILALSGIGIVILLGIIGRFIYVKTTQKIEIPVKTIEVLDSINGYNYKLEDRDTALYKEKFLKLKETLESEKIDKKEYASLLAELFVIDLYTIDNKNSKYDVGALDFIYPEEQEKFSNMAMDSLYKLVEDNSDNKRTQELPIVSETKITKMENAKYTKLGTSFNGYKIHINISYEKQLDYDESVVVTVLEENEKMYVVSFSPEEL